VCGVGPNLKVDLSKILKKMKKYIVISDEVLESVLARLAEGKYVEGTLHRDKWTGNIVFNCWNRKPRQKQEETVVGRTFFGRVTETPRRYKLYESLPKVMGIPRMMKAIDHDIAEAKSAITTNEIIEFI
jgi:hypothetical protein